MAYIMKQLRQPLPVLNTASISIDHRVDYLHDETGLPQSDVIEFFLAGNLKFVVRPSGTEPKLKAYLFSSSDSQEEAERHLDALELSVRRLCE